MFPAILLGMKLPPASQEAWEYAQPLLSEYTCSYRLPSIPDAAIAPEPVPVT
jgi:hypothetical protein